MGAGAAHDQSDTAAQHVCLFVCGIADVTLDLARFEPGIRLDPLFVPDFAPIKALAAVRASDY